MSRKIEAIFVMCIVLVATFYADETAAAVVPEEFRSCFNTCKGECTAQGGQSTACEIKCDGECSSKETIAKLMTVNGK